MRKKVLAFLLSLILCASVLSGCVFFTYDTAKDYSRVVATVAPVEIDLSTDITGESVSVYVTEESKIYKYELVSLLNNYGSTYINSYGYTQDKTVEALLDNLVMRKIVLNEADALIYYNLVRFASYRNDDGKVKNSVKKSIYTEIDSEIETYKNSILEERGLDVTETEDSSDTSTDTTYPVKETEEAGVYDDYSDDELIAEMIKRATAADENKFAARLTELGRNHIINWLEADDDTKEPVWSPDRARYPGEYGADDDRSLEKEAFRRFYNSLKETVDNDYRITDTQKKEFKAEFEAFDKIANEKGLSEVYGQLGDSKIMEFLIGSSYYQDEKISVVENYIKANVSITTDIVQTSYNKTLAAQKTTFKASGTDYKTAIDNGDTIVYFPDDSYYFVKHILIPFSTAQTAALTAYEKSPEGKINGDAGKTEYKNRLANEITSYEHRDGEDYGAPLTIEQIYTDIVNQMNKVTSLKDKINTFDDLIYKYNTDTGIFDKTLGYAVKKDTGEDDYDSTYMEEFALAAKELYENGQLGAISGKVVTDYGVHIVFFLKQVSPLGETVAINGYETSAQTKSIYEKLKSEEEDTQVDSKFSAWQNEMTERYKAKEKITKYEDIYSDLLSDDE